MEPKCTMLLKKYTGHDYIELTSRGNTAIFAAMYCARKLRPFKKKALIPDQGGWLSYKKYPKMLELEIVEVKTDYGLLDIEDLRKKLDGANCLIYQNPAGYFAAQDHKKIYETCKGKCTVIMDASGSLADPELCDGKYADIMVSSFGEGKPVNLGYGGFVSFAEEKNHKLPGEIFNTTSFDEKYCPELYEKLKGLPERLKMLYRKAMQVKKDLVKHSVLHWNRRGINVVVAYGTEADKQEIIEYCKKEKLEYTQCPRYIRVMRDAISIEIKRL